MATPQIQRRITSAIGTALRERLSFLEAERVGNPDTAEVARLTERIDELRGALIDIVGAIHTEEVIAGRGYFNWLELANSMVPDGAEPIVKGAPESGDSLGLVQLRDTVYRNYASQQLATQLLHTLYDKASHAYLRDTGYATGRAASFVKATHYPSEKDAIAAQEEMEARGCTDIEYRAILWFSEFVLLSKQDET